MLEIYLARDEFGKCPTTVLTTKSVPGEAPVLATGQSTRLRSGSGPAWSPRGRERCTTAFAAEVRVCGEAVPRLIPLASARAVRRVFARGDSRGTNGHQPDSRAQIGPNRLRAIRIRGVAQLQVFRISTGRRGESSSWGRRPYKQEVTGSSPSTAHDQEARQGGKRRVRRWPGHLGGVCGSAWKPLPPEPVHADMHGCTTDRPRLLRLGPRGPVALPSTDIRGPWSPRSSVKGQQESPLVAR